MKKAEKHYMAWKLCLALKGMTGHEKHEGALKA
jgi:hypothetical protein